LVIYQESLHDVRSTKCKKVACYNTLHKASILDYMDSGLSV